MNQPPGGLGDTGMWRAATANGATLGWALRAARQNIEVPLGARGTRVQWAIRLAAVVPIGVVDRLFTYGWATDELYGLMFRTEGGPAVGFGETARRLTALHRVAPESYGPDLGSRWNAVAAVLAAGQAGLTDLQSLRWMRAVTPKEWTLGHFGWLDQERAERIQEWAAVAGAGGWAWPAAGYTIEEARLLLALPETDPARPTDDQLVVMAALQQT